MKTWQAVVLGCFVGLIASGLVLFIALPPRGDPVILVPPPTPSPFIVYIAGAVYKPGVYTLPSGSRVVDLIAAAGGLLPEADADAINQAAKLLDGQKVMIPRKGINSTGTPSSTMITVQYPLNINYASQQELENLPGIGPTKARDIISYREKHNSFKSVDELLKVPGIGPETLDQISDLITVQ